MKSHAEDINAIRQYLLGLLPLAEQEPLEVRFLTDDALYEELLIAEDELIDQYLAGNLAGAERESFENHFLVTPERRQKVRFSRALRRYIEAGGERPTQDAAESPGESGGVARPVLRNLAFLSSLRSRNPVLAFSLAAAALLLVFSVSWTVFRDLRLQREPRQVLTVLLTPGLTREGGEITKIAIPPGTDVVQFRLRLPTDEQQSYRAVLLTAEGSAVLTSETLKPEAADNSKVVVISVPPQLMRPGDYQLKLSGISIGGDSESVDRYPFRVVSR